MQRARPRLVAPESPPGAVTVVERKRFYGEGLGAELIELDSEPFFEEPHDLS